MTLHDDLVTRDCDICGRELQDDELDDPTADWCHDCAELNRRYEEAVAATDDDEALSHIRINYSIELRRLDGR